MAGNYISQIEKYDETKNEWINVVNIPQLARAFQGSVIVDDKAYLMGGYTETGITSDIYVSTGTSYSVMGQMPAPAYAMSNATDEEYIYTIGGINSNGYLNTFRQYDIKKGYGEYCLICRLTALTAKRRIGMDMSMSSAGQTKPDACLMYIGLT